MIVTHLRVTLVVKLYSISFFKKSFFWQRGRLQNFANLRKWWSLSKKKHLKKKDIGYNFATKVTLRCVTINCMSQFFDKMAYFFKIMFFSSNFHQIFTKNCILSWKNGIFGHFLNFDRFFVLLSCSNPRTTIYFLKATCLSFHLSYITYLYLENYSSQNFFRQIAGQ